ncbi:flagellar assembly protein FliH [Halobacillus salinus]|uniref:Flagellar assembly protein FliH n=1 Tax=Halobacillus salinus TaxID=192814 RepID=A0A4Z0H341_9BACI|nr:flagellar assembly protein FliH [Halobacillus salinus]
MTSLSNRVIKIKPILSPNEEVEHEGHGQSSLAQQKQEEALLKLEEAEKTKAAAHEEAEQMRQALKVEMEEARQGWASEREALIESAKQEGYREGLEQGLEDAKMQFEEKLNQANEIIDQANASFHQTVRSSEETIIELALVSAERIIGYELDQKDEAFVEVVKRAIREVRDQPEITVTVHPDQYHHVFSQQDELQRITHSRADLSIYVRDDVDPHACLIESPFGLINAGVDQQLSELRQTLFEVVNEELGNE